MKQIKLTQGKVTLVDDEDYEYLNQFKWFTAKNRNAFYAVRVLPRKDGKRITIWMHRVILNTPIGMETDHIDHNGLNNTKVNLRVCSRTENGMNRCNNRNSASQYKGVCWNKQNTKWTAGIRINGKLKYLGYFDSEIEAAKCYDQAAILHQSGFANLNFKPIT